MFFFLNKKNFGHIIFKQALYNIIYSVFKKFETLQFSIIDRHCYAMVNTNLITFIIIIHLKKTQPCVIA